MKADRDDSEEDEPVSEPALVRLDSVQTDLLEVLKDWNSYSTQSQCVRITMWIFFSFHLFVPPLDLGL